MSTRPFTIPAIVAVLALGVIKSALGDDEAAPFPWIKTSEDGQIRFKMVPSAWRVKNGQVVTDRKAFGVAYRVGKNGEFEELWRTDGWYSFEVFLSNDGTHLARIGPWASDQRNHSDLAIAFYDRGKLLKEYQVRNLIKKPDKLEESVSHYMWRPRKQSEPNGFRERLFHLVMIDKTSYTFDIDTGEITSAGVDLGARSFREIFAEEKGVSARKGRELLDRWSAKDAFEKEFELSEVEVLHGITGGVYFDGPEWRAHLKPREGLKADCLVEAVFPILHEQQIDALLTPAEIREALEKGLEHPFVAQCFDSGGATGLRLRVTGDRLHWDTPKLEELLKKLGRKQLEKGKVRQWAGIIIDAKEPRYTSIFLNTESGELIYEDESKWPLEPVLLDRMGKRIKVDEVSGR